MHRTKKLIRYPTVSLFGIENDWTLHKELCSLLYDMGFEEEDVDELDTTLPDLEGGYFFLEQEALHAHVFITTPIVYVVFDTPQAHDGLVRAMLARFPLTSVQEL